MMKTTDIPTTIDDYIAQEPVHNRQLLENIRAAIRKAAPEATEKISYQMPTFYLKGNLVHFAFYKNHVGFYPSPSGIEAFKEELTQYKTSKGAIQFPINQPLPLDLITRITLFRVKENIERAEIKEKKR